MKTLFRFLLVFFVLSLVAGVLMRYSQIDFGIIDYWERHGVLFLIFIAIFPRLTLLFSSVATGGVIWWLAWLFAPRILVAILATIAYWQTNPILVSISWVIALFGESAEKTTVKNRTDIVIRGKRK
jgi:uncharacterized membrane protein YtjA (UPF0391 family)